MKAGDKVSIFLKTFLKMSNEAAKLIFYGTKLSLGVLVVGILAYKYNQWYVGSYANGVCCIEIIRAAFSLFVQFILGGIILDCTKAKK